MKILLCAASIAAITLSTSAMAQDHSQHAGHSSHNHARTAPLGVMGDHLHPKGEWMFGYRYMRMDMDGQRDGTSSLSPEDIAGNAARFPNPNAGPAGFRIVPLRMTTEMHMVNAMYGVTDWLTVMAMGSYVKKEMDHVTFQGGAGTTRLGEFTTRASGLGDSSVSGLFRVYEQGNTSIHANLGLSLPTGSIDEEDDVLAPNGTRPTLRLPYAMQLGSGTFDALPGVTYVGHKDAFGWGAQYSATIRLEDENSEGYRLGDRHVVTTWGSYQALPWLNVNARGTFETLGDIDGSDPLITAPVTTADTGNYGGEYGSIGAGFTITPQQFELKGHELAFEATLPVYQDLNGPQLERDFALTAGWAYRF